MGFEHPAHLSLVRKLRPLLASTFAIEYRLLPAGHGGAAKPRQRFAEIAHPCRQGLADESLCELFFYAL
ncbi:MAG: hypothetical protein EB006_03525 [Betaproteobacteria bacterium]|nr:hypothetical protein [Betaproteobacteria bacterium]